MLLEFRSFYLVDPDQIHEIRQFGEHELRYFSSQKIKKLRYF